MSEGHRSQAQEETSYLAMSIPIGAGVGVPLGVVLGVALDNMGFMSLGIAIGLSMGVAIGAALDQRRKRDNA